MSDTFKNASATAKNNLVKFDLYLAALGLDEQAMDILDTYAEIFYLAGRADALKEEADKKQLEL